MKQGSKQRSTGISRAVLMALQDGQKSSAEILNLIGPHAETVHQGTIWTILSRARLNGLVARERIGRSYFYRLTDGGQRRTAWILQQASKGKRLAVANPKKEKPIS